MHTHKEYPNDLLAIRATDNSYSRPQYSYLLRRNGAWFCQLDNGMNAAFSYAGIAHNRETEAEIALSRAETAEDALIVCERLGSPRYVYEIV